MAREGPPKVLSPKVEPVAGRNRGVAHPAIAELPASARLLLVASLPFGARADRLAIGDARATQLGRDAELAPQLRQRDLEMALAESRDERLVRLGAPLRGEARILVMEAMEP